MKKWVFVELCFLPGPAFTANPDGITLQCGGYKPELIPDSLFRIDGKTVAPQKVRALGNEDGMKVDTNLMSTKDDSNYDFEFICRLGTEVRFLNVQLLRNSMDAPKVIGSSPCKEVPGQILKLCRYKPVAQQLVATLMGGLDLPTNLLRLVRYRTKLTITTPSARERTHDDRNTIRKSTRVFRTI